MRVAFQQLMQRSVRTLCPQLPVTEPTSAAANPEGSSRSPKLFSKNPIGWRANRRSFAFSNLPPSRYRASVGTLRMHSCAKVGGEYRARTGDLLVANQALSQLS